MRVVRSARAMAVFLVSAAFLSASAVPQTAICLPCMRYAFAGTTSQSSLAGSYRGRAPSNDAAKRIFTLQLGEDGSAILTIVYIGDEKASERGHWTWNGKQVVLTFEPIGPHPPPRPIIFRYRRTALQPIRWDRSEWGDRGPPVFYRERSGIVALDSSCSLTIPPLLESRRIHFSDSAKSLREASVLPSFSRRAACCLNTDFIFLPG